MSGFIVVRIRFVATFDVFLRVTSRSHVWGEICAQSGR